MIVAPVPEPTPSALGLPATKAGISGGALAGIVVGAVILVLGLALWALLAWTSLLFCLGRNKKPDDAVVPPTRPTASSVSSGYQPKMLSLTAVLEMVFIYRVLRPFSPKQTFTRTVRRRSTRRSTAFRCFRRENACSSNENGHQPTRIFPRSESPLIFSFRLPSPTC